MKSGPLDRPTRELSCWVRSSVATRAGVPADHLPLKVSFTAWPPGPTALGGIGELMWRLAEREKTNS